MFQLSLCSSFAYLQFAHLHIRPGDSYFCWRKNEKGATKKRAGKKIGSE
jgi:hypothetical protein